MEALDEDAAAGAAGVAGASVRAFFLVGTALSDASSTEALDEDATVGAGDANTGNGADAIMSSTGGSFTGRNGGSGVIIIAYPDTFADLTSIGAGLTATLSTVSRSGYKVYTFSAGTGSIII